MHQTIIDLQNALKTAMLAKDTVTTSAVRMIIAGQKEKDVEARGKGKEKADDIYKRVALINKTNTLIYISIHANSYPNSLVKGAQTFYKDREDNLLLAKNIQDNLKQIDLSNNRVHKPITNKYIVDNITKTGCLVEVGFLSNLEESIKLNSDDYFEMGTLFCRQTKQPKIYRCCE